MSADAALRISADKFLHGSGLMRRGGRVLCVFFYKFLGLEAGVVDCRCGEDYAL